MAETVWFEFELRGLRRGGGAGGYLLFSHEVKVGKRDSKLPPDIYILFVVSHTASLCEEL